MGRGGLIMVISVYMPPFLTVDCNGRIVHHPLIQLVMKLVVTQFCRAKNDE